MPLLDPEAYYGLPGRPRISVRSNTNVWTTGDVWYRSLKRLTAATVNAAVVTPTAIVKVDVDCDVWGIIVANNSSSGSTNLGITLWLNSTTQSFVTFPVCANGANLQFMLAAPLRLHAGTTIYFTSTYSGGGGSIPDIDLIATEPSASTWITPYGWTAPGCGFVASGNSTTRIVSLGQLVSCTSGTSGAWGSYGTSSTARTVDEYVIGYWVSGVVGNTNSTQSAVEISLGPGRQLLTSLSHRGSTGFSDPVIIPQVGRGSLIPAGQQFAARAVTDITLAATPTVFVSSVPTFAFRGA